MRCAIKATFISITFNIYYGVEVLFIHFTQKKVLWMQPRWLDMKILKTRLVFYRTCVRNLAPTMYYYQHSGRLTCYFRHNIQVFFLLYRPNFFLCASMISWLSVMRFIILISSLVCHTLSAYIYKGDEHLMVSHRKYEIRSI